MNSFSLLKDSAAHPLVFLLVDVSDHITGVTGLTPTVTISKNGGSFAAPAGAVSEIGNGWYKVAADSDDTDTLGQLVLHAEDAAADPTDALFAVVGYDPDGDGNGYMKSHVKQMDADVVDSSALDVSAALKIWTAVSVQNLSAVPINSDTVQAALSYLFMMARNKRTQTATTETLFMADDTTPVGTASVDDDGTTFTKGQMA